MDLLIHAIIWLFKALFGDSEEQARVGPRRDSDSSSGGYRRGPYDYGDGRSSGSGGTKTLAELLEEARRQSGAAPSRPAAPQQPPPARVAPPAQAGSAPQGTRSLADLLDEARRQGRAPQAPAQQPMQRAPAAPVAPAAPAFSVPPPQQPQPSKKKKRKRRDEPKPAPAPAAAASAQAGMHGMRTMQGTEGMHGMRTMQGTEGMHGMRTMHGMRSAKTHRGMHVSAEGREVGRFVAELRSATGDEKRMAGARAVAMLEVFGAPRSKRPHRPGTRLF